MGSEMGGNERGVSTGEFSLNKWKPLLCFKGKIAKWRHILITSVASWDVYANFQRYVSIGIRGSKTPASVMWKTQPFKHHQQIALMLFQRKEERGRVVTRVLLQFHITVCWQYECPFTQRWVFPLFFQGGDPSYPFAVCHFMTLSQFCAVAHHSHLHKQFCLWWTLPMHLNSSDFTTKISGTWWPRGWLSPKPQGWADCHILLKHVRLCAVGTWWCWHPSAQICALGKTSSRRNCYLKVIVLYLPG